MRFRGNPEYSVKFDSPGRFGEKPEYFATFVRNRNQDRRIETEEATSFDHHFHEVEIFSNVWITNKDFVKRQL